MKSASIIMAIYSVSMVFYGTLEIGHDFLHYLADRQHSSMHSHDHEHGHAMRDHDHRHHHHDRLQLEAQTPGSDLQEQSASTNISLYLFTQSGPNFQFSNQFLTGLYADRSPRLLAPTKYPIVPPPKYDQC